jgi:hypothetical protein
MKKMALLLLVFSSVSFFSCGVSKPYSEEIKLNLRELFKKDQEVQNFNSKRLEDKKYLDSMNLQVHTMYKNNCEIVKQYFKKYAYPGLKENGKEACTNFWVIVQHSDHDVAFQEAVLNAMTKQYKKNNVDKRKYAYLQDRVLKNKGEKQIYGTQVGWSTGKPVPLPLKHPEKVDELRKVMELEPLQEYLDSFSKSN